HAVGLAYDEGVAARDRRVVEAQIGGQRAADPRPLAGERDGHDAVTGVVGEVLAGFGHQAGARLGEPVGPVVLGVVGLLPREARSREQRGTHEFLAAAPGAFGQRVLCRERDDVVAVLALERADTGQRARMKWLHTLLVERWAPRRDRCGFYSRGQSWNPGKGGVLGPLGGFVEHLTNSTPMALFGDPESLERELRR